MAEHDEQLAALRREIDSIDTKLHNLLMQRTELAVKVGEVKAQAQPIGRAPSEGAKFMRPAREAQILRRLVARHKGRLAKGVIVRMWREMISALLQVEGPFVVAVYTPADEPGYWDLARDHYGSRVPVQSFDRINHAISAVLDGQATVAVLPLPHEDDRDPWWRRIAVNGPNVPHVVARLPFGDPGNQRGKGLQALVIGTTANEPSEHDRGLLVAETRDPVSRSTLRDALNAAQLKPVYIQAFHETGRPEQHLVEAEGFLATDDPRLAVLARSLGADSRAIGIGGYAVPLTPAELAANDDEAPKRGAPKTPDRGSSVEEARREHSDGESI